MYHREIDLDTREALAVINSEEEYERLIANYADVGWETVPDMDTGEPRPSFSIFYVQKLMDEVQQVYGQELYDKLYKKYNLKTILETPITLVDWPAI